jgi:hypothetical protein
MTVIEPAGMGLRAGPKTPLGHPTRRDERPPQDEERSIAGVVEALVAMFPAVPEPHIRDCVAHIRAGFATAPIRAYIPILVARQARAALLHSSPTADGTRVG